MIKVLVVEDNQFLIAAYRAKLAKSGYQVEIAQDVESAKKLLKTLTPDVILLDIIMPGADGYQLLTELKQSPALKSIPVIVATNLDEKADVERARSLGAAGYIVKTDLSMNDLINKIKSVLAAKDITSHATIVPEGDSP